MKIIPLGFFTPPPPLPQPPGSHQLTASPRPREEAQAGLRSTEGCGLRRTASPSCSRSLSVPCALTITAKINISLARFFQQAPKRGSVAHCCKRVMQPSNVHHTPSEHFTCSESGRDTHSTAFSMLFAVTMRVLLLGPWKSHDPCCRVQSLELRNKDGGRAPVDWSLSG